MPESTANAGNTAEGAGTAQAGGENPTREGSRTFTQEEVNSMLAKERRDTEAKFAGYADLKAKAEEFDKMQEAGKSELEKANDKLAKANAELSALKAEKERAELVAQVARDNGVPLAVVAALNGKDAEELAEQAKAVAEQYAQPKGAPSVPEAGVFPKADAAAQTTAQQFAAALDDSGF